MEHDRRGVRYPFVVTAEVAPESSPSAGISVTIKELSLYGCFLEASSPFAAKTAVLVRVFGTQEYFEAKATVIYMNAALGMGLAFREVKPVFRAVLQKWLLAAMHKEDEPSEMPPLFNS